MGKNKQSKTLPLLYCVDENDASIASKIISQEIIQISQEYRLNLPYSEELFIGGPCPTICVETYDRIKNNSCRFLELNQIIEEEKEKAIDVLLPHVKALSNLLTAGMLKISNDTKTSPLEVINAINESSILTVGLNNHSDQNENIKFWGTYFLHALFRACHFREQLSLAYVTKDQLVDRNLTAGAVTATKHALHSIFISQNSFEKGLINYFKAHQNENTEALLRQYQSVNAELEQFRKDRALGGKNSKKPPKGLDDAIRVGLEQILKLDENQQLYKRHVIDLVREYTIEHCNQHGFDWSENQAFKFDWFKGNIGNYAELPSYLSELKGKTRKGKDAAISKIEQELNINTNRK